MRKIPLCLPYLPFSHSPKSLSLSLFLTLSISIFLMFSFSQYKASTCYQLPAWLPEDGHSHLLLSNFLPRRPSPALSSSPLLAIGQNGLPLEPLAAHGASGALGKISCHMQAGWHPQHLGQSLVSGRGQQPPALSINHQGPLCSLFLYPGSKDCHPVTL